LLGGDPGVASRAAQVLMERYAGLEIAGTLSPQLDFEKDPGAFERIQQQIAKVAPQIVFVALGFPKQDIVIRRLRSALPETSFVGVGISLSFVAGVVPRAPTWTHGAGLEWFHRLLHEPARLSRRYLLQGAPFALELLISAGWQRARR
jgi:N-acetylglucosaminyldiphosphoundecaprenol N-acetyl-beta-D-mannosaminyltransferase